MATQFEIDAALMAGCAYQTNHAPQEIPLGDGAVDRVGIVDGIAGAIDHTMGWKEEVLLHDGQIIVAEHFYSFVSQQA